MLDGVFSGVTKMAIGAAAGIGTVALANRTGIAPVLEQGLTFGSRLLNRAATYSSNKAIEDWTIRDFRRLSSGMKNAFQEAKDSLGTFYIDPHDNRTLFGTVSSIQSLMGDGSKVMSRQLFRQEKVINPTIDWYRQHNVSKRFDENTNKRIENFIRAIASAPRDKNELYSAQKALGAYEDRNLKRTTDALIRKVQELDKNLVAKTKYRRRTDVGIRNIVDVALDIEKLEKEFGTIRKKPSAFEQLLRGEKDRAVTIRDLLRHNGMAKGIAYHTAKDGQDLRRDPIQELREIAEYGRTRFKENPDWYERFMDLTPDAAGLRMAGNGLIYSTEGRRQFTDSLLSAVANTLPGKILKMRDVSYSRVAPKVFRWAKGVSDPVLASLTNEEKNKKSSQVDSTLIRVYDNYYRMSSRGALEDLGDLGGTHLYSGKFGATQHLIKQMSGDIRYKQSENAILRKLDLFQDRDEYSGKGPTKFIKSLVDKYDDPNYIGNIIDDLSSDTMSQAIIDAEKLGRVDFALDYVNRAKALHSFMKETTIEFDRDTARSLSETASGPSEDILEALATKTPKELEDYLLSLKPDDIINKPLSDLANKLRTNREELIQTIETGYGRDRKNLGSSLLNVIGTGIGKEASTYEDTIRKELSKEALLRSGLDESSGAMNYDDILNLVNSASLTTRQRTEVRRLAHLATFEDKTLKRSPGVSGDGSLGDKELFDQVYDINVALSNNKIRETLQLSKKEHLNWQTTHYSDIDEIGNPAEYNTWSTIRNSETPVDVLSSLNDWSKLKASISRFGGQFAAGRDNMGEVSEMTLAPYFMLSRLSDEMNILGVGFSKDSMGSTFDMMKSIALKRILPVAVGSTYLEWLDDTSEEVTGISIAGAAAQGIANVDLAVRKTLDFIGMTDWLKGEKALNPIMQYWGDHTEFMSYDERKEWYESGYEPVRKGAWWTFGGVNEARGAEISYWQPSFVRRIQSDYLDKSLYDGYFDKWSHSLLPTPANPLSPFIGLADPYWLEEKHKDDRPYMLTGEMFASGTPWGAILNPTVGALLKPQKSLHEIPILGFNYRNINGVDPMSLMHAINMEIKQKARDLAHMNYVKVDGDQFTPVNISEYENYAGDRSEEHATYKNGTAVEKTEGFGTKKEPTQEEITAEDIRAAKEANINIASPGEIIDYKLTGAKNPFETPGAIYNDGDGVKIVPTAEKLAEQRHEARELKLEDELEIEKLLYGDEDGIRSAIVGLIKKYNPIKTISELNEGVKEKAKKKRSAGTSDEYESEDGIVQAQKLKHFKPSNSMELLNDADTVSEMVNAGKGSDMVRDAAISWRLVSGIYGYAFGATTGFGVDDKKVIATGADMTSFSRTFWDSNVGGAGGGVMEIARRFIPDFRRGTRINPLMNEMPDWLPERFKFGDAYCVSGDTLIEIDDLNFVEAKYVRRNNFVLTHKGNKIKVRDLAIRKIEPKEKVYEIKINTLSAVSSKFSESHPILTCTNPKAGKSSHKVQSKYKIEEQCNKVLMGLANGITNKRALAKLANSDIDDISRIFKKMFEDGLIEDYRDRKKCFHDIILKSLNFYNPSFTRVGICWKKAKDLKVGDYVAYPLPKKQKEEKIIIDAKKFTSYPCTNKYVYASGQAKSNFGEIYEWFEEGNYKGAFAPGERKRLLEEKDWETKTFESAQHMWKINKIPERYNRFIEIDEELSYAIGLYLAEGYNNKGSISYCLHEKEGSYFNRSVDAIIKAVCPSIQKCIRWKNIANTHGAQGYIYSSFISELFYYLVGKYCHSKRIPSFYWNTSENHILRLIEGYIDGDGCAFIDKSENKFSSRGTPIISATSINLKMLLQFRKLLLKFSIVASISSYNKRGEIVHFPTYDSHMNENYHLMIRGKQAEKLHKLLWGDNFDIEEKDVVSKSPYFVRDGYLFIRISSIKECPEIHSVYGFEVGTDNSFCTAGVATHNTTIPKGEMRLPGKGYEAINELHPDQYGSYGSFDRMKILADIAPFSPEYRLWRDIAKKTVTDPELIEEMEEIRERVNQQGKKHDFYDYKVVGRGLEYKNVVVSDILDYGKFKSGNTTYKIAGASIRANEAETMKDVLGRYIHVGQEITIAVDEDEYSGKNKDTVGSVNAAVFIEGQNIGLEMIEQGDATVRKGDTSSAALLANYGPVQKGIAYMSELFAHADVPWLSDQFLRVRSPTESYKAEQVYGTPYQSWEHPISSFLMPAVERAVHDRSAFTPLIGTAARAIDDIPGLTPGMNHFTKAAWLLNDRGAFIGFALANLVNPGNKMAMQWARHGSAIATAGHFLTGGNSYFDEITSGGQIGYEVGRLLEKNRGKAAAIGATVGMAYRTLFGDESDWIPDRTKEKWEMQDYFDRLTYIKYMGLYRRAAELAEEEEGVDVEDLLERREELAFENSKAIDKFKRLKKKLRRKEFYGEPSEEMVDILNEKIEYLENDNMAMVLGDLSGIMSFFDRKIRTLDRENTMVEVGEWTRIALLYKQAADSTMYGLKDNSSWSQIVTALPTNDREYFMEFVKVTNPERREEILRYASPALKRALALAWGKKPEKQESNEDFFKKHELPKANWAGWAPQYDLKDIEVKTIENEGMMLADFGYYDSQLRDPKVQDAPTTNYSGTDEEHNELAVKKNLQKILYGSGLKDVDISVQPGPSGGVTSIIAIVKTMLGFGETQERVNESLSMQASM